MRMILILVLGLAIGAVAATMAGNALRLRDAYPRGAMAVMQHHLGALRQAVRNGQCPAAGSRAHLLRLQAMQAEILPAFAGDIGTRDDFRKHADRLASAVDAALQAAPADCPGLQRQVASIGETCQSCHEAYR